MISTVIVIYHNVYVHDTLMFIMFSILHYIVCNCNADNIDSANNDDDSGHNGRAGWARTGRVYYY